MIKMSCLTGKNYNRETLTKHDSWKSHSVIAKFRFKRIKKNQELPPLCKFVTEVLIFWSSRSRVFFKIGVLKNLVILEPLSNKVAGLPLQNTYGGCSWIFVAANTFFQLNLVFIADSRTGFCSSFLWKYDLNFRSSHWSCSVKKVFLKILQLSTKTPVLKFLLIALQAFIKKRLQHRCFPVEFTKFSRTPNLKPANDCFSNLFFHLDCHF